MNFDDAGTQEVGPFTTFDVMLSYNTGDSNRNRWLNGIGLNLVVQNVFDTQPLFVDTPILNGFDFDATRSGSAVLGRFASLSAVKRF